MSHTPLGSKQQTRLERAIQALDRLPAQGTTVGLLDAIAGCVPVQAGLLLSFCQGSGEGMCAHALRVPEPIFEAWMGTEPALLNHVLAPVIDAPEGGLLLDRETVGERLRPSLRVMRELHRHGLGEGAGVKLLERRRPGGEREQVVLALLKARHDRFADEDQRMLALMGPVLREAARRIDVPLIPSEPILTQIVEQGELGYVCLSARGALREANRRAHEVVATFGPGLGLSRRRAALRDFADMALAKTEGARTWSITSTAERKHLDVSRVRLRAESHAADEDIALLLLRETPMLLPSEHPAAAAALEKLTPTEQAVAKQLVDTSLLYEGAAGALKMNIGTFRTHVNNVYRKLKVGSRHELIARFSARRA
ncbi:hypothetical protein WMF45_44935 [Sorangium sp. So ce448]|uniref:hypothetical protein n=1 Tax=Sorangium sp. So ce448 TaxID=3133314 RepID=UPI003F62B860